MKKIVFVWAWVSALLIMGVALSEMSRTYHTTEIPLDLAINEINDDEIFVPARIEDGKMARGFAIKFGTAGLPESKRQIRDIQNQIVECAQAVSPFVKEHGALAVFTPDWEPVDSDTAAEVVEMPCGVDAAGTVKYRKIAIIPHFARRAREIASAALYALAFSVILVAGATVVKMAMWWRAIHAALWTVLLATLLDIWRGLRFYCAHGQSSWVPSLDLLTLVFLLWTILILWYAWAHYTTSKQEA